ncbi:MAG: 1-deoxy-D-xylulose-5-phosphate reductoisomerase [Candidatus Marsarchaeota archaeon]|nr:1-deoxy-D-xylulose-5-phosphate reductoisomerase [Candidatus Marsarchaeota archaeon]
MKNVSIIGSTGSIGRQTLDIIRKDKSIKVIGLSGNNNLELLERQVLEFKPKYVWSPKITSSCWNNSYVMPQEAIAALSENNLVIISTVGSAGLLSTINAINAKRTIAIANKEVLVMAGSIIIEAAKKQGTTILPIDSEHNAIWQCLIGDCNMHAGSTYGPLKRIILTASGGAFRDLPIERLASVSVDEALAHPTWVMGKKITIDCATLMNKGFEVIEARWLFGIDFSKISVLLHRESIIHGMVEFYDGSYKALLSYPDMHMPIQHVLSYPKRPCSEWKQLDLVALKTLSFSELDVNRYPCFKLALSAGRIDGSMSVALNASNEAAVGLFLDKKICFGMIPKIIEKELSNHQIEYNKNIPSIIELDNEIKSRIRRDYT